MKYADARPNIQSGDLLAWVGNGWFSWFIQWFSRDKYSHVGIAYWADRELFVFEAREGKGVRLIRLSTALPFYWCALGGTWRPEARAFAHSELGREYSWGDIFRIAIGKKVKNDGRWFCSEIAREIMRINGRKVPDSDETPSELMEYAQRASLKIEYVEL